MNNEDTHCSLRRIITGLDKPGRSVFLIDGPPAESLDFGEGAGLYEIWTEEAGRMSRRDESDRGKGPVSLCPSDGAIKVRWFTIPPAPEGASSAAIEERAAAVFDSMGAGGNRLPDARHPHMHVTSTIDCIVLVKGRVKLLLDDDERVLSPGDVVIQRGVNHAWSCEGNEPAVLVAVLIDKQLAD